MNSNIWDDRSIYIHIGTFNFNFIYINPSVSKTEILMKDTDQV